MSDYVDDIIHDLDDVEEWRMEKKQAWKDGIFPGAIVVCVRPIAKLKEKVAYKVEATNMRKGKKIVKVLNDRGWYSATRFRKTDKLDRFVMRRPVIQNIKKKILERRK